MRQVKTARPTIRAQTAQVLTKAPTKVPTNLPTALLTMRQTVAVSRIFVGAAPLSTV